jgi:hypothetical protein
MLFVTCSLAKALDVSLHECSQEIFGNQGYAKKKNN